MGVGCVNWVEAGVFRFCRMHRDEACAECKYFASRDAAPESDGADAPERMPLST